MQEENIAVSAACQALGGSRSNFYKVMKNKEMKSQKDHIITMEIEKIILELPGYGYRRVTRELKNRGMVNNHKKILRIMRDHHLTCKTKRKFHPATTDSNHQFTIYPNVAKGFVPTGINQLWVADITYVRLFTGFCYLAVILDAFSRKAVGYTMGLDLSENLTLEALKMALKARNISGTLIHHSDQGVQYASTNYTNLLREKTIQISMSRKGNPYDNAFAESFIKTLKREEVHLYEYENFLEAKMRIESFIVGVYNKKRLHSGIGYLSPEQFENSLVNNQMISVSF